MRLNPKELEAHLSEEADFQNKIRSKDIRRDKFRLEHEKELKEKEDARLSRTKRKDLVLTFEP